MFVIAGASGKTGSVVASEFLARGENVRLIVRDPAKVAALVGRANGRAETVDASLDDATELGNALRGANVKGAYLLLPPQEESIEANANRAVVYAKAIEASGIPHVVFLSSVGAQHASGTGPILSVHHGEKELRKVTAAVTFLRAAYFVENLAGSFFALDKGVFPTFFRPDRAVPMVPTIDIGKAAAAALLEGAPAGAKRVFELSGARDLTSKDIAAALSNVLGKPIHVETGPEESMVAALLGAGFSQERAALYAEMTHGLTTGHVAWEGGNARAIRGSTPLETVLAQLLGIDARAKA